MSESTQTPAPKAPSDQSRGKKRKRGGRKAGTPNKFTGEMREAFTLAFQRLGGPDALEAWARKNPGAFFKLIARLLPAGGGQTTQTTVNVGVGMLPPTDGEAITLSDDPIEAQREYDLIMRGVTPPSTRRAANVIQHQANAVAALAAPEMQEPATMIDVAEPHADMVPEPIAAPVASPEAVDVEPNGAPISPSIWTRLAPTEAAPLPSLRKSKSAAARRRTEHERQLEIENAKARREAAERERRLREEAERLGDTDGV